VLSESVRCCPLPSTRQKRGQPFSAGSYIESVFENELGELDPASTLAAAEVNEHALVTAEFVASTSPPTGLTFIPATPL